MSGAQIEMTRIRYKKNVQLTREQLKEVVEQQNQLHNQLLMQNQLLLNDLHVAYKRMISWSATHTTNL